MLVNPIAIYTTLNDDDDVTKGQRERESSLCGASVQVGQLHALMINILMQEISLNATKKKEM